MARTYRIVVGPKDTGKRLDRFLVQHLPETISRSMIQRSIEEGQVTVNEGRVKVGRALRRGEVVHARLTSLLAKPSKITVLPQPIALDFVFEDPYFLIVNKPAGLVTHPAPGHWDGTLVNAVLWHLQAVEKVRGKRRRKTDEEEIVPLPRAGIIHRLDKDTSGLLIIAKTDAARLKLMRQMKARTISRRYLALVEGVIPFDQGTVSASIGRHQRHRKIMAIRHVGGRTAVTHYRVIKRFGLAAGRKEAVTKPFVYTLIEASLETGRTHQIRVHLAHLGNPVLGDATYSKRAASAWEALGIRRQMLHAYRLTLTHPKTDQPMTFAAPIPQDMLQWLPDLDGTV